MSTVTTTWIMNLADRISGPVRNLTRNVTVATNIGDRMNGIYSRSESIFNRLGTAVMGASSRVLLLKNQFREAASEIPGFDSALRMIKNPAAMAVALGTGLVYAGKRAYDFNKGMAEVNATTQLSEKKLDVLKGKLMDIGKDSGGNFDRVPKSFEAINSVLDDVGISLKVLEASVMGSKAGFADLDVVGSSIAKTMSIVGKENTNAQEVLDTFMQAKSIGSGEFEDFANYMPSLIASGKALGVEYQDVAGIFAFMTTKAANASEATMLISNAFSALGKSDVRDKLAKNLGVSLFDKEGMVRDFGDVIMEMSSKFSGMSDQKKAITIESAGFTDVQAKTAFSMLLGDAAGLQKMMDETNNSLGATQRALEATNNPARTWGELMDKASFILVKIGDKVLPLFDKGVSFLIKTLSWFENPYVESALNGIGNALLILWTVLKYPIIAVAALTLAFAALNFVFAISPLGWLVIGFVAVVTALTMAWEHSEKFRGAILGMWEVIKGFGGAIKEFVLDNIERLLSGLGGVASAIYKLFKGEFKEALTDAKEGLGNLASLDPVSMVARGGQAMYNEGKLSADKFNAGFNSGKKKLEKEEGWSMMNNIATADNQNKTTDKTIDNTTQDTKVSAGSNGSGSGSGSGKTITMNLEVKQYFSGVKDSSGDILKIANKVIEVVNDRLRDGLIALE